MVDPVNSTGQTQNIKATQAKTPHQETQKQERKEAASKSDEVVLSDDALALQQAEDTAKKASAYLASEGLATLSADPQRLNALV